MPNLEANYHKLLSELKGVRLQSPHHASALCPAHDDRSASLSLTLTADRLLFRCHAGCSFQQITAALQISPQDCFEAPPQSSSRPPQSKPKAELDARGRLRWWSARHQALVTESCRYRYLNADGSLAFSIVRSSPKDFRPLSLKGTLSLDKADRVPYRLPDVLQAIQEQKAVVLVEGEKDADAGARLGLHTTTFAHGAGRAEDHELNWLQGAIVVLVPDNDGPGKRGMRELAARLGPIARRLVWLELPGLSEKGDLSDWLEVPGNDLEAFKALVNTQGGSPPSPLEPDQELLSCAQADPDLARRQLEQLSELDEFDYEQVRTQEARKRGMRTRVLDKLVAGTRRKREELSQSPFFEVTPFEHPVSGAKLLDEIVQTTRRFIIAEEQTLQAVSLWIALSWFIDVVQVAPLALITAPEKRCGKTQLLNLISRLVRKPISAGNISPSALFRAMEKWQPTLLLDETDTFLKENEDLRGLLNAGHTRDSAFVIRCVGEEHEPACFSVWGAKCLSGIGSLPETIMDRSVILELRRKRKDEHTERLRHASSELFVQLRSQLARFALDAADEVRDARPAPLEQLNDRAQDNWEPLLAIASAAGGHWPETARAAALKLSQSADSVPSIKVELLRDIESIFAAKRVQSLSSSALIEALCEEEDGPWASYNRGKPLHPRQLSTKLKAFGIGSKNLRIAGEVLKGFERDDFQDALQRYVHGEEARIYPLHATNGPQAAPTGACRVADRKNVSATNSLSATLKPPKERVVACSGKIRPLGEGALKTQSTPYSGSL